jgi:hypothetical protein
MTMLRASEFRHTLVRRKRRTTPLTPSEVKAIRAEKCPEKNKHEWYLQMACKYNCSAKTINNIVLGLTHRKANYKWLARQKARDATSR